MDNEWFFDNFCCWIKIFSSEISSHCTLKLLHKMHTQIWSHLLFELHICTMDAHLAESCSWLCVHGMISCTCRALPDLTFFYFLLCTWDSSRPGTSAPPMVVKFLSVRAAKLLLRHNNNKICQEEEEEEEEEREIIEVNSIYTRWGGRTHCSISQITIAYSWM